MPLTNEAAAPTPTEQEALRLAEEKYRENWNAYAPGLLEAMNDLAQKHGPTSSQEGFRYRVDPHKGRIETNIPQMKNLSDCSIPTLLDKPDGDDGVSIVLLVNNYGANNPMGAIMGDLINLIRVDLCKGVLKILPSTPQNIKEIASHINNRFHNCEAPAIVEAPARQSPTDRLKDRFGALKNALKR